MVLPHFVIIGGVSGSGKSTIAKELSERLNYEFVDADDYHSRENVEKMSKGIGLNDEDRRPWLESLSHYGDRTNNVVLACSALKRSYRQILTSNRSSDQCQIFLLLVDRNVLEERLANRINHYAKTSLLDSQLKTLELKQCDEINVHMVDVDGKSVQQVVDEIAARLEKRHH